MKYIINERQYRLLTEQEVLHISSLNVFGGWEALQKFLEKKDNPLYSFEGYLNLRGTNIESLGNLTSVGGLLDLKGTPISRKYSRAEIRQMVKVDGEIYF